MMKIVKRLTAVVLAAVLLSTLFACTGQEKEQGKKQEVLNMRATGTDYTVESYEELYAIMSESAEKNGSGMDLAVDDETVDEIHSESYATVTEATNSISAHDYSGTNVQVEGVDEGDIIKTDGEYIYIIRSGCVTIVDASEMKELCTFEVDGREYSNVDHMYLKGDRLAVVLSVNAWYRNYLESGEDIYELNYTEETAVILYDISDRSAPKKIREFIQDGSLCSTRLIGSKLYTVSTYGVAISYAAADEPTTYVPTVMVDDCEKLISCGDINIFPETESNVYNIITSIDIGEAEKYDSVKAAFGSRGTIYADNDSLLIAATCYISDETESDDGKWIAREGYNETSLLLYDLNDGIITKKASASIPGTLLNQFSIDEYNGYYRFVTNDHRYKDTVYTEGIDRYEYESSDTNGLYVLDSELNPVGSIDGLAEDESVKSVRFDGDVAYFVTFRYVDPLFTVDLSDPTEPKVMSELKIPGFSSYLHKFGDGRLFGLGYNADETSGFTEGLKLSMFDTSNPYDVTEKHVLLLEESWSEALYNHKAILVSVEKNLIAFPSEYGYAVYGYDDESGFYVKNRVELDEDEKYFSFGDYRGLFIDNSFYVCSDLGIARFSLDGFESTGNLALSEIVIECY